MDFSTQVASQLNVGATLPEIIVTITLLLVIIIDLISGRKVAVPLAYFSVVGLLASVVALALQWNSANVDSFLGAFTADNLSIVFRAIVALSTALTILMSIAYIQNTGTSLAEFVGILLTATLGGMLLSGASELVMIFVSLEMLSISSYLMTGYMKRDVRSNEAALKYLLIGAASSAIFLYGSSLLYGLSGGKTNINEIAATVPAAGGIESLALAIALVFMVAGVAFKISAVPFHQWTPDVYEGSPTPVVAFLSVGSKAAGFAIAVRLLVTVFAPLEQQWHFIFAALAILSMVLGNVVALAQTSMKRMLAYSSIGQAGFIMIGLVAGTEAGYSSVIFYLFLYLFMNLGAFACVILFSLRTGTDKISDYAGLYQKDPLLTLGLSLCLLSLGGIPPLAGFFGKIYIFWAGWQAGLYSLVFIGLITSVISIYYYIRVVKMMVVKEPQEMSEAVRNYPPIRWNLTGMRPIQVSLIFLIVATSLLGILSNPVVELANQSVASSNILKSPITSAHQSTSPSLTTSL
ncbi:MAG: NAD(P)H-quinone oxidoreductase subunit N [Geminocystis sp.]|nr:NAD(P)H-quinone oxidoreductase subunit N [Geminocystis sp.]HIK36978.1 NAD(P)H-quinone oxidoreductase subunit N [Geminocystis sp. M7585_C2015_104]MCS7147101.1 NAD(P)H-quinone oxidoreductase subunit N [Geminocystis sp.]MCX8079150.1 NAD(P)H-quinone oxidoreductase subunit N [Geminocystis sp.]MDW8116737.1 NAD(P)H-quinone oxidoreductase subunit N [Geminocystis sp.]